MSPPFTRIGGEEIREETSNIRMIKERLGNTIPSDDYDRASDSADEDECTTHHEHKNDDEQAILFLWRFTTERSIVLDVHLSGKMSVGEV